MTLQFVSANGAINRIRPDILEMMRNTQSHAIERSFKSAAELCRAACIPAGVDPTLAKSMDEPLRPFIDLAHKDIVAKLLPSASTLRVSRSGTVSLADNIQLLRAFASPASIIEKVRAKVDQIVDGFPRKARDLEQGRNPGDVLDPFLLSATQHLLCDGDIEEGLKASVLHKCMMMIENLAGNLHQDVIGAMRGNIRVPEPRGEMLHPTNNPFPGADVLQVPLRQGEQLRFFQVKSKTGSAKGGDGIRLGEQLKALVDTYGGEAWYSAIVGKTLDGHRSMAGVRRAYPDVIVTVGAATLQQITRSPVGGELLLRVYQSAFRDVARARGYTARQVANAIAEEFRQRLGVGDDELLDGILRDVTEGNSASQDSRFYKSAKGRRNGAQAPKAATKDSKPRRRK